MDAIVKQAMAKWPNVPHCYGWLALDARGAWRMCDEHAQNLQLPGEKIVHRALLDFINRNYTHDERGCWYFQNGPQRVYVNLEATPYIARTDPQHDFILHTGEILETIDSAWLTDNGQLILENTGRVAMVDDRDTMQCLEKLYVGETVVSDEQLAAWLTGPATSDRLVLRYKDERITVSRIAADALAGRFGFIKTPDPLPSHA